MSKAHFKSIEKEIRLKIIQVLLVNETLDIVIKEYPEIVAKAIIQTVEKNPELFKIECPICHSDLHKTDDPHGYYFCNKCIKGFNIEELEKLKGVLNNARVPKEDNAPNGLSGV